MGSDGCHPSPDAAGLQVGILLHCPAYTVGFMFPRGTSLLL